MAFVIPKKSFLSFSKKQAVDTLWRIAMQIDQGWHKEEYRLNELKSLHSYTEFMASEHPSAIIQSFCQSLLEIFPSTQEQLSHWMMAIEREDKKDLKDEDFLISTQDKTQQSSAPTLPIVLVLDNLRSSFNVGSLFRTAESLGIKEIHLCGYTPTPENSKTAKSALGTQEWVKWRYWESTLDCLAHLKDEKVQTLAFETEEKAVDINEFQADFPCAIVLGNERYGLSSEVLKRVDQTLKVKMLGRKNSLNVGVCGAIAIHQIISTYEPQSQ